MVYLLPHVTPPGLHLGTLTGIHPSLWLSRREDMEDLLHLWQDQCQELQQGQVQGESMC